MSVYVDKMMPCLVNKNWKWPTCCHLVADTIKELHNFAHKLKLKKSWYQHKTLPHYDLTTNKRHQALKLGAIEISDKQLVKFIHKQRIIKCLKKKYIK